MSTSDGMTPWHGSMGRVISSSYSRGGICRNAKATKLEVAKEMIRRYPELSPYLSSDRKWKESFQYNMFDAVALGTASAEQEKRGGPTR